MKTFFSIWLVKKINKYLLLFLYNLKSCEKKEKRQRRYMGIWEEPRILV